MAITDTTGIWLSGTIVVDPASIAAGAAGNTVVAVAGALTTDVVCLTPPSDLEAGLAVQGGFVATAGNITVRMVNHSAAAVDGASKTWRYALIRGASGIGWAG